MMKSSEQTRREEALKLLADYRAGEVPASGYRTMIMQWGKARLFEARPAIEPFLRSPDVSLRTTALDVLGNMFALQDYWSVAVQFLLYDPDYQARTVGASALASMQDHTKDRRTLGVLASVVADRYDYELVRVDAYRAMFVVARGYQLAYDDWDALEAASDEPFDVDRDADWDFVNGCIDPQLEEEWQREARMLLEQYRAGKVAEQEYYAMLRKFGRARLQEARKDVEEFLSSPVLLLRTTALRVLVLYLQISNGWQVVVDMFEHDPDEANRLAALDVLSQLMAGTHDKATLRILYPLAYDAQRGKGVFGAILKIYPGDFGEIKDYLAAP
ncbi:MAG TPA: hypothetical protein VFB60_14415 [Ktedonobacteraceae bacterium]|nr:hypothetical protein [Ktedonobacteraceae bacterium]